MTDLLPPTPDTDRTFPITTLPPTPPPPHHGFSASTNTSLPSASSDTFLAALSALRNGANVSERTLVMICKAVKSLLVEDSNVLPISPPCIIVGDLHGQFYDLLKLFSTGGEISDGTNYVFLGDYVDRGSHSVETLSMLFLCKVLWPERVTLLRGNHESRQITQVYGFYDECLKKFGNAAPWRLCMDVFDYFSLSAVVGQSIFCVHGGLSPELRTLDQIRSIDRNQEVPHEGGFCDLMWSDPEDISEPWQISPRGAGYLFGSRVTDEFNDVNGLNLIARAHQLVMEVHSDRPSERGRWNTRRGNHTSFSNTP